MGYVPAVMPPRLNLDVFGMPKDYATYVWLLYRRLVEDRSPTRQAFLERGSADLRPQWRPLLSVSRDTR